MQWLYTLEIITMVAIISKIFVASMMGLSFIISAWAAEMSTLHRLQQKVLADHGIGIEKSVFGGQTELDYFVHITEGLFRMGNVEGGGPHFEHPVHNVYIKNFLLGKNEVTFAEWDACVASGGCSHTPSDSGWGRGNRPVVNVSWQDINKQYIPWLYKITGKRYRLPTEAEWEYAARAGSDTIREEWYSRNKANCAGCGSSWDNSKTAPVASFEANDFGVHDMHGNVWEWTQDCWNNSYMGAPNDGSAWLSGNCFNRILRGGAWYTVPSRMYSTRRVSENSKERHSGAGFRIARDID